MHKKNRQNAGFSLLYKLIDRFVKIFQSLIITGFHSIYNAVVDVILKDHFTDVIDGGTHSCDLDQNLTAVPSAFNHGPNGFHMTNCAVHAV